MNRKYGNARAGATAPAAAIVLMLSVLPVLLRAQNDVRGRIDLDYTRTDIQSILQSSFNQTLELSVSDNLFVKNVVTLSYFLERFSSTQQSDDVVKQRWRANMVGRYYSFTGEYLPRYQLRGTSGSDSQFGTGKRFALVLSPPKAPTVTLAYDRLERTGGVGTGEVNVVAVDRLASTTHQYKFMNFRGLLRDNRTKSKVQFGQDRRIRDVNAGVGANIPMPRKVRMSADYDFSFTDDKGGPQTESETMVNNVSSNTSIRPTRWLHGFVSFLGNYIDRKGDTDDNSALSEVVSGVNFIPVEFLRISGSRSYRRIREESRLSITDFFRVRVNMRGRVRERIEGRATFSRTFVLRSVEGSFPSQGFLFNVNALLYPDVILNSDFNIIHSKNPDRPGSQFQIRRTLDLRMIPTRKVSLNTSVQTLSFGEELPWFDTQSYTVEFDINYQPTQRLTTILTFSRKENNIRIGQRDFIITGTATYQFREGTNLSILYNRRGGGSKRSSRDGATSFTSATEGFLIQLSMKLRERTDINITFDTRELPENERMEIIGANFIKWF